MMARRTVAPSKQKRKILQTRKATSKKDSITLQRIRRDGRKWCSTSPRSDTAWRDLIVGNGMRELHGNTRRRPTSFTRAKPEHRRSPTPALTGLRRSIWLLLISLISVRDLRPAKSEECAMQPTYGASSAADDFLAHLKGEFRWAEGKITYLGTQTRPILTVVFSTPDAPTRRTLEYFTEFQAQPHAHSNDRLSHI